MEPRGLQIEVTSRCNFRCVYCMRNFWNAKAQDMPFKLFRKISNSFSEVERVILYGFGEPLIHPEFMEIVKLTKESLKKDGEILLSTNGSLLNEKVAEKLLRVGINLISFSLDTTENFALEQLRIGAEIHTILENIKAISRLKRLSKYPFNLAIEVALMEDTLEHLLNLIEFAAQNDVDKILVTNIVPYSEEIANKQLFLTVSEESYNIVKDVLDDGWKIIHDAVVESKALVYTGKASFHALEKYRAIWKKADEVGCGINLPMLLQMKSRLKNIERTSEVLKEVMNFALDYGVDLELPNQFASRERSCPYIEKDFTFVRADGSVAPCMEFAYTHNEYVNLHRKLVKEISFGNILEESLEKIWSSDFFGDFRILRKDLNKNFPWCGECVYSSLGCYYSSSSEKDCIGNLNSCSECLYSAKIASCTL